MYDGLSSPIAEDTYYTSSSLLTSYFSKYHKTLTTQIYMLFFLGSVPVAQEEKKKTREQVLTLQKPSGSGAALISHLGQHHWDVF